MLEINKQDEQPTQNANPAPLPAEQTEGEVETTETLEASEELNEGEEIVEPTTEPEAEV